MSLTVPGHREPNKDIAVDEDESWTIDVISRTTIINPKKMTRTVTTLDTLIDLP